MVEAQTNDQLIGRAEEALDEMQVSEALRLFQEAEDRGHDPDQCAAGRWTCYMLRGEFEKAWGESDAIEGRGQPDPHRFWDGTPLHGRRVILRCLHGLGDTIQFIRFAPYIRSQANLLIVEAQPGLKTLLAEANVADHVITWGETPPAWDLQIEVNELPRWFRVTEATIPRNIPYLRIGRRQGGVHGEDGKVRVGLIWSASAYNPLRSLTLKQLAPLFKLRHCAFFSLQAGPACTELRDLNYAIPNVSENAADVLETAENMLSMDLIITVDTMTAHLSGALGLPTWILLPFACDWRWMVQRTDSPWYPTARLFRQDRPGDWDGVVRRLTSSLETLSAERAGSYRFTGSDR